jgi:hypothetical protein
VNFYSFKSFLQNELISFRLYAARLVDDLVASGRPDAVGAAKVLWKLLLVGNSKEKMQMNKLRDEIKTNRE